ncbi:MAG: hypothetical protein JRF72_04945 [Deltaproteobacteria bacterium]|jgi:hypothetical protein|nr:hypothetical protein [Deltaproteobacteria bacterium]
MKKRLSFIVCIAFLWITGIGLAADAPSKIGPFALNQNISDFKDYVIMETALPIRHLENINEVEIKPVEGFKSGLIAYATCTAPGHIVRIKLKYLDSSKKFYENLLKRIKKRFGDPVEYRGDPFHMVVGWKWSFVDKNNNRISLNLQHNTGDLEEKQGNSIKLTMTSLIEKDKLCYIQSELDHREKLRQRNWRVMETGLKDWDRFVPR